VFSIFFGSKFLEHDGREIDDGGFVVEAPQHLRSAGSIEAKARIQKDFSE
jgi:hypothetical protein